LLRLFCCGRWRRALGWTLSWPFRRLGSRSGTCRGLLSTGCRPLSRRRTRCGLLIGTRGGPISGTIRWWLIRPRRWSIRRPLCRCRASCWPVCRRLILTCHRAIRRSVSRTIVWLCAWRAIISSRRPRARLCGVRLSHRAIPWPSRWLSIRSFIRLVRIRRRPRTVRRPIVWLDRTRLSCSPALSRSICRLLVIRRARPVCRIVLWLPRLRLPRTIGHVALGARPICRIVLWLPWLGLT
jgi:hypothetical protein